MFEEIIFQFFCVKKKAREKCDRAIIALGVEKEISFTVKKIYQLLEWVEYKRLDLVFSWLKRKSKSWKAVDGDMENGTF